MNDNLGGSEGKVTSILHNRVKKYKPKGLVDNGTTVIKCSNCYCPLVLVLSSNPNQTVEWKISKIKCPYCGDFSYESPPIKLGFLGHTDYCNYTDTELNGDFLTILVEKGEKKWPKT